jgi:hypothetical protein
MGQPRLPQALLGELGEHFGVQRFDEVRQLSEVNWSWSIADGTDKFILQIAPSTRLFLIVSNRVAPLMVQRNVQRMRMARSLLSGDMLESIELPLMEGAFEDRSYAVWRMLKPLSPNRVWSKIQQSIICPSVFRWISNARVYKSLSKDIPSSLSHWRDNAAEHLAARRPLDRKCFKGTDCHGLCHHRLAWGHFRWAAFFRPREVCLLDQNDAQETSPTY